LGGIEADVRVFRQRQRRRRPEPSRSFPTEVLISTSQSLQKSIHRPNGPIRLTFGHNYRLLDLGSAELRDLVHARARRRFDRGLKRKPMGLIKKLRKSKKEAKPNEKPDLVKTHLRDMIIVPEMIGSIVGVYSGKEFNQVEIRPEMVGHYLGEFSIS